MNIVFSIKTGLMRKGVTQNELASALGVIPQVVSFWVTGTRMPKLNDVAAMANYFGVPVSEFIKWGE